MEAEVNSVCFVCKGPFESDDVTVRERGVKSFIEASLKRKDGNHVFLENRAEVQVHDACRKTYTNHRMILAATRKSIVDKTQETASRRSSTPVFLFKNGCFLCGKDITDAWLQAEARKSQKDRDKVVLVQKLEVRVQVEALAELRNDAWGRAIINRIKAIDDLVAADAQYHASCMKKLYYRPKSVATETKPKGFTDQVDEAMSYIFSYLENNSDECQFLLTDLVDQIKCDYKPEL